MRDISRRQSRASRAYDPRISPRRRVSVKSAVRSLFSEPASRTPNQAKVLRMFTKELELHLQATKNLPRKTLIPSPSVTTIHTVQALSPYRAQFAAAGLAVTSEEQRGKSTIVTQPALSNDLKCCSLASPVLKSPAKDSKCCSLASPKTNKPANLDGVPLKRTRGSYQSFQTLSSDHTILDFTPPHERVTRAYIEASKPTRPPPPLPMSPAVSPTTSIPPPAVSPPTPPTTPDKGRQTASRIVSGQLVHRALPVAESASPPTRKLLPWLRQRSADSSVTKVVDVSRDEVAPADTPFSVSVRSYEAQSSDSRGSRVARPAVPDPVKRQHPTNVGVRSNIMRAQTARDKRSYIRKKLDSALPPIPIPEPIQRSSAPITDKGIFRGLRVATAAACDEEVDEWVTEITGYGVRQFLGELGQFDILKREHNAA